MRGYLVVPIFLFTISTHGVCAFAVSDGAAKETFFIRLTDPVHIAEARAIVSGKETTRVAVAGLVVTEPAAYNQPWHFHLAPESISFFKQAIEVCDATTSYVEAHLDEVGGAFLPGNKWCRGHRG